jgi:hypothetical protein
LASLSELTPRDRKPCEHIRHYKSALCKLKKKNKGKKLRNLCDVDRDPLMENLSSSFRNSRRRPKRRRWNFDEKCWLCLSLNVVQNPISFSVHYPLSHPLAVCPEYCSI